MKILLNLGIESVSAETDYKKGDRAIIKIDRGQYALVTVKSVRRGKWQLIFDDGDEGECDDINDFVSKAGPTKFDGIFKRDDIAKYKLKPVAVVSEKPSKTDSKPARRTRKADSGYAELADFIINPTNRVEKPPVSTSPAPKPKPEFPPSPNENPVWADGWNTYFRGGKPKINKSVLKARMKQVWQDGWDAAKALQAKNAASKPPVAAVESENPTHKPRAAVQRKTTTRELGVTIKPTKGTRRTESGYAELADAIINPTDQHSTPTMRNIQRAATKAEVDENNRRAGVVEEAKQHRRDSSFVRRRKP